MECVSIGSPFHPAHRPGYSPRSLAADAGWGGRVPGLLEPRLPRPCAIPSKGRPIDPGRAVVPGLNGAEWRTNRRQLRENRAIRGGPVPQAAGEHAGIGTTKDADENYFATCRERNPVEAGSPQVQLATSYGSMFQARGGTP